MTSFFCLSQRPDYSSIFYRSKLELAYYNFLTDILPYFVSTHACSGIKTPMKPPRRQAASGVRFYPPFFSREESLLKSFLSSTLLIASLIDDQPSCRAVKHLELCAETTSPCSVSIPRSRLVLGAIGVLIVSTLSPCLPFSRLSPYFFRTHELASLRATVSARQLNRSWAWDAGVW